MAPSRKEEIKFECVITNPRSLRSLASAFSCLAKLGKECTLEAHPRRFLNLRQVNEAKTSFIRFKTQSDFFDSFSVLGDTGITVKLTLRNCLAPFRSTRSVDRLSISFVTIDDSRNVVVFRTECKNPMVKTHQFFFEDADAMDPFLEEEDTRHRIQARPKLLIEALNHVHGIDEVDMEVAAGVGMVLRAEQEPSLSNQSMLPSSSNTPTSQRRRRGAAKATISTEMKLPHDDFDKFEITVPRAKYTFSVRELKQLLVYCEAPGVDITDVLLLLNDSGEPILFTSELEAFTISVPCSDADGEASTRLVASELPDDIGLDGHRRRVSMSFSLILATIPPDNNDGQEEELLE